jgi:hypothetical protein
MNPKSFHFQLQGLRGLPAVLVFILFGVLIVALIAVVLLLGTAVVIGGALASCGAAVYWGVRKFLTGRSPKVDLPQQPPSHVRIIDVETLSLDDK